MYNYESRFDRFRPTPKTSWKDKPGAGAGILLDLGSHLVDQTVVLFGAPTSVSADVMAQRETATVNDVVELRLRYKGERDAAPRLE